MELFDTVFNTVSMYDMLFFNIKSVLEYPTLMKLKEEKPIMFERWKYISINKYMMVDITDVDGNFTSNEAWDEIYLKNAVHYVEFCKIVAISYGTVSSVDGKPERFFKSIKNNDEATVIETFMKVLHDTSEEKNFPTLCGYNIIAYEIPFLLKRYLINSSKFEKQEIPLIIKRQLSAKPWESGIVDVANVYKFNGATSTPLLLISDSLGLKRNVDLVDSNELSQYYWKNVDELDKTLDWISLQSLTQINIIVQLINKLRQY
jgi:hypothetical protein